MPQRRQSVGQELDNVLLALKHRSVQPQHAAASLSPTRIRVPSTGSPSVTIGSVAPGDPLQMVLQFNRRELGALGRVRAQHDRCPWPTVAGQGQLWRARFNAPGCHHQVNRNDVNVIVIADAGSRDATARVADIAGCRFMASSASIGVRLRTAATSIRTPWLLFLPAGTVPQPGWIDAADRFIQATELLEGAARAAVFRPPGATDLMRPGHCRTLEPAAGRTRRRSTARAALVAGYEEIGCHPDSANAEAALLRRLGRRRIAMLSATATRP